VKDIARHISRTIAKRWRAPKLFADSAPQLPKITFAPEAAEIARQQLFDPWMLERKAAGAILFPQTAPAGSRQPSKGKTMKPKLYKVAQAGQPPRLILAANKPTALAHAAKSTFVVTLADPMDCAKLGAAGIVAEDSTAAPAVIDDSGNSGDNTNATGGDA
jgi:hypothetical protein